MPLNAIDVLFTNVVCTDVVIASSNFFFKICCQNKSLVRQKYLTKCLELIISTKHAISPASGRLCPWTHYSNCDLFVTSPVAVSKAAMLVISMYMTKS